MNHADWCSQPEPRPDPQGVVKCPSCKYIAPAPKPRLMPASNYRCKEHPEQPVTWRGTGCTRCAAERTKRKAPASRDTEEMERYR